MLPLMMPIILPARQRYARAVDFREYAASDEAGLGAYTLVLKIRPRVIHAGGQPLKLVLRGPNTILGNTGFDTVYVGTPATSGDAWDFSATPTQVFFNGKAAHAWIARQTLVSDPVDLELDPSEAFMVAMDISTGGAPVRRFVDTSESRGVVSYVKAATSEAGQANKGSGYTAVPNTSYAIQRILAADYL